jgi:hypothetical protein
VALAEQLERILDKLEALVVAVFTVLVVELLVLELLDKGIMVVLAILRELLMEAVVVEQERLAQTAHQE